MILISSLLVFALLGRVELFKIHAKAPQGGVEQQTEAYYRAPLFLPPARLYPAQGYYQPQPLIKQEGIKGAPAPLVRQPLPVPLPAQPLAYVIVRAVQVPQYQYLRPVRYQPAYYPMAAPQPIYQAPVLPQATKGGEPLRNIEQQRELEQTQQQGQETAVMVPVHDKKGKFSKLKSHLEQFAASARSRLSLGSSYQVISEEIVATPQPQQAPLAQEQIQQEQIRETQQEEEVSNQQVEEEQPRAVQAVKEAPRAQPVKEAPRLQSPSETKARKEQTRHQPAQQQQVAQSSATF